MSRRFGLLVVLAFILGAAYLARRLLEERSPEHGLNGSGHVAGSLDTWPPVPAKPTTPKLD